MEDNNKIRLDALGQKQTFVMQKGMSALPLNADVRGSAATNGESNRNTAVPLADRYIPERWSSLSCSCSFFKNGVRCCLFECLVVLPMVLARLLGTQTASIEIT